VVPTHLPTPEELKQQFLASFETKISHLEQALEEQDTQALIVSAHQLAGSSGSYGYEDIADLCCEIESMNTVLEDSIDLKTLQKTRQLIQLMQQHLKK